jgi:hypothetical protein
VSSALDVEAIAKNLDTATSFTAVFGTLPTGDHKVQRSAVRKQFAYLAQIVHPDHVHDAPDLAERAFEHLRALFNAAEAAILDGSYDKPFPAGIKPGSKPIEDYFELTSKTVTYRCNDTPYRTGDFSFLYQAQVDGKDLLVKIAKEPTANALLETEATRLRKFRTTESMKGIHRFLPEIIDSMIIPGPGGKQYRANVMSFSPAMLSLADIKSHFPAGGLIPQQAAWIVRRVMAQTCAAAMAGVVHASITPDHVLVDPIKHEPCHIGWLHATERTPLTIVDRWKDWYPPEIFAKQVPTHQTDIYMAAKTCIWLFSGDTHTNLMLPTIPKPITDILMKCVDESPRSRPSDGLKVLTELTTAIRSAWGRSYKPLLLPL